MKIWLKLGVFILLIISFAQSIYALNVDLTSPVDNAIYVDSNTVVFKCRAAGDDLRFIELYNNIGGWSKKAEVSNLQSNTDVIFSVKNISNGNYIWNCKAIDGIEGVRFSSSNRSFSISIAANNPPTYNGGLVSQSWNVNTQRSNAFDLDNFFSDPDGNTLTYTVNGNANINVNIDSNNVVSFSQPASWFGTEKIYFTANDGQAATSSSYINLTVINTQTSPPQQSTGNTAPKIETKIPDQTKTLDIDFWILDLTGFAKDTEDSESKLNWSVDGVNSDLLKIEIDNTNKRAKFTTKGKTGSNTITLTVTDSGSLSASQQVKIILNVVPVKETTTLTEFDDTTKTSGKLEIKSHSPISQEITLNESQIMTFTIDPSIQGDIEWYLNNELLGVAKPYFDFNSREEKTHNLTVYVTDLEITVSNSWFITIKKSEEIKTTNLNEVKPICGNNIIEENENCSNCPVDVKCLNNQVCESGICKESKGLSSITGSSVLNFENLPKNIFIYPLIILGLILITSIIIIRRKNKIKYSKELEEFGNKETFFSRFRKRLIEREREKRQRKENKVNLKNLESQKIAEVSSLAPSISQISSFIKESSANGHSKKAIKKALREKGWSRIQIWKGFRNI